MTVPHLLGSHVQLPTGLELPDAIREAASEGLAAALRRAVSERGVAEVCIAAYITRREGLREVGMGPALLERPSTFVVLFPPDGATREDARWLAQVCGDRCRQVALTADDRRLLHQKIVLVRYTDGVTLAFFGSANLSTGGMHSNLELGTIVRLPGDGSSMVERIWDGLWSASERLEPLGYVANAWTPDHANFLHFQVKAYEELRRAFGRHSRVALVLPTGAGKTRIAMRYLLQQVLTDSKKRVMWIAPANELLEQAFTGFRRERPLARLETVEPCLPKALGGSGARVPASSPLELWTLHELARKLNVADAVPDLLVLDEAHWGLSPKAKMLPQVLERLGGRAVLGLTATPFRGHHSETDVFLQEFEAIVPQSALDPEDPSLVNSVGERVFSRIHSEPVKTGVRVELSELRVDQRSLQWRLDKVEHKVSAKIAADRKRNELIAEKWASGKWKATLMFAASCDHANTLARTLRKRAPRATLQVVHSQSLPPIGNVVEPTRKDRVLTMAERLEIRRRVATGGISCVIAVDMYNRGVDFPAVDTLFLTRPTLSPVMYAQMVGRGLRGTAFGGTSECTVVDFCDQIESHGQVLDALMTYRHFSEGRPPSHTIKDQDRKAVRAVDNPREPPPGPRASTLKRKLWEAAVEALDAGALPRGRSLRAGERSSRFLVAPRPVHASGHEFNSAYQIGNGLWLETNWNARDLRRLCKQLRSLAVKARRDADGSAKPMRHKTTTRRTTVRMHMAHVKSRPSPEVLGKGRIRYREGTRLVAEHAGERYEAVVENGVLRILRLPSMKNKRFRSLSRAAREITGYSTNGRTFWRSGR